METTIRIGNKSEILQQQRFYAPTYLTSSDGSVVLFIGDAAEVRGPSGRTRLRSNTDVIEYATEAEMVDAVVGGDWIEDERLDGDTRKWKPPTLGVTEDTDAG